MPTVADIREELRVREEARFSFEAESEWQRALKCAEQYSPDEKAISPQSLDWRGNAAWKRHPNLSPRGEYAVRCAGGWQALERARYDPKEATWKHKEFVEAYKTYRQVERLGLTDGESRKLLDKVRMDTGLSH